eukprot:1394993-Amorphochlora_amoeboformis.AAC.1
MYITLNFDIKEVRLGDCGSCDVLDEAAEFDRDLLSEAVFFDRNLEALAFESGAPLDELELDRVLVGEAGAFGGPRCFGDVEAEFERLSVIVDL